MKIVGRDSFDRETVADRLLISGVPDEELGRAEEFCDWLNSFTCHEIHGGTHYAVVENDYRLSRGMEDLV